MCSVQVHRIHSMHVFYSPFLSIFGHVVRTHVNECVLVHVMLAYSYRVQWNCDSTALAKRVWSSAKGKEYKKTAIRMSFCCCCCCCFSIFHFDSSIYYYTYTQCNTEIFLHLFFYYLFHTHSLILAFFGHLLFGHTICLRFFVVYACRVNLFMYANEYERQNKYGSEDGIRSNIPQTELFIFTMNMTMLQCARSGLDWNDRTTDFIITLRKHQIHEFAMTLTPLDRWI